MTRDYIAEMGEAITAALGSGDVVAPVVAEKLHAELLEKDADLLEGWLRASAVHFLTRTIGDRDRRERTTARTRAGARDFAEAAEAGDTERLSTFAVRLVVAEDNTRRPIGEMTGADHKFVASEYGRSAATARMLQAFHTAVAKRVGKKKTAEVMDEATYERLYQSIVRPEPPTAVPEAKAS
jgi:hypothetical protein